MKGLLIKDFRLMKNQKTFLVIIGFIAAMLLVTTDNPSFVICYVTILFSMFAVTTLSYDEYDNGSAFLFSLPLKRKTYVMEKYIFSLLLGGIAWAVITLLSTACLYFRLPEENIEEYLLSAVIYFGILLIFTTLILPMQFKFGAEKGRIAILGFVGIVFILVFIGSKLLKPMGIDLDAVISEISKVKPVQVVIWLFVSSLVLLCVSYMISVKIMEKKEF